MSAEHLTSAVVKALGYVPSGSLVSRIREALAAHNCQARPRIGMGQDVAAELGYSPQAVSNWVNRDGKMPAECILARCRGGVVYDLDATVAWAKREGLYRGPAS